MEQAIQNPKDKWIPRYFVMFFAVIALLDGIFVYTAISTQTGVVTKHPYEKGIAFNETLAKAKAQPHISHKTTYHDGVLRLKLPIETASVTASIIRPVQDGYDFDIKLAHIGDGIYEATIDTPLKGAWTAKLKATWNDNQFQTSHDFIVK